MQSNNHDNILAKWSNHHPQFRHIVEDVLCVMYTKEWVGKILTSLEQNDKAHQPDHVLGVTLEAERIIDDNPELKPFRFEIITAAFLHDIGCRVDRATHHEIGAEYVMNDEFLSARVNYDTRLIISGAILKHRASWTGCDRTDIEDVVAAADRGEPNIKRYLKRACLYRYGQYESERGVNCVVTEAEVDEIVNASIDHLRDKFGPDGYVWAKYPRYGLKYYSKVIKEIKDKLSNDISDDNKAYIKGLYLHAKRNFYNWIKQ
ncbi:HD domain-containing protein [Proteus mirabilis]|uniref:HD domain-containing protein n=1 Tax=Proteus mirabilis TaxID=584 RepID=UPI0034D5F979